MTGMIQTVDAFYEAVGDQTIADLSAAVGLTPPAGAEFAWIQAQGKDVRMRDSGSNPTDSIGLLLGASGLTIWYQADLSQPKFIEVEAGASLFVSYYKSIRLE